MFFFGKNLALKTAICWVLGGSEKNRLFFDVENGLADVTDTLQNDHHLPQHNLRVLNTTGQWHRSPRSAGTHDMSQPAAVATCLFCISLGSAVTFFR